MFASVIIDQDAKALDRVFTYRIPNGQNITEGMRVIVPFGQRTLQGFVIAINEQTSLEDNKIKSIYHAVEDFPVIKPELLQLMDFMCDKFHLRQTSVLRLFLPTEMREGKVKELFEKYAVLSENIDENSLKRAKKQLEAVKYLQSQGRTKLALLKENFGESAIKSLIEKGCILLELEKVNRAPLTIEKENKSVILNAQQQNAIESVGKNGTYLLHGVTGSGKTEVYMHLISRALSEGKNAIMLVPEISLTPQVVSIFKARFGDKIALLHSSLSAGERFDEWRRIFAGEAQVVVGARSAIFAPIENLGMIIIDEEHEQSYVSESNPRYITQDVAAFRAQKNNCPLVLGSATPSVDDYQRAKEGEIKLIEMPVRANGKELPKIQIIDMMNEIRAGNSGNFSTQLISDLAKVINDKKQAMIFINRRGYSSFMMCRECGYVAKCHDCDVSLVYHREDNRLKCHYCGKQYKVLDQCPKCGSDKIKQGAVGTEKVVDQLKSIFPDVKILRMDNDTTSKKNAHQKILSEFAATKPAILVGTQMIAKGHDFEDVTLVGIVDADQSLYRSDYRSTERCFQLITQVSGRAGRSQWEGKVDLQTYSPRHYVYKFAANYDYKAFFKKEANIRQTAQFPPFSKIIRILFSHSDENVVKNELKSCYNKLLQVREKYFDDIIYMDAMKSPIKRIKNSYRYQVIIRLKLNNCKQIEDEIFACTQDGLKSSVFFEVNPENMS